ncbi:SPRY domain-containing SOCS box protein 1 [Trichinella spiralis]|uniref:SPRY domain-containing SOCS box protein 1 n=1 Tax=Trichinella spiralis TaxID=6334 RepID=UPI0001EFEEAB|nr:SPRY domain-containing SOCS box protein 1 [Trichinella spiralis]
MEAQEQKGGEEVFSVRIRHASWTNKTRHNDIQFDVGQKFAFDKVGRVRWENRCKTGKSWKESAFVAATGILYLLIRRLVVRKQAQKAKITNDIKIYREFRHESQSNELKVFIADDSRLDCIAASMLTVK